MEKKKLSLSKETIRDLKVRSAVKAGGPGGPDTGWTLNSTRCPTHPPTRVPV